VSDLINEDQAMTLVLMFLCDLQLSHVVISIGVTLTQDVTPEVCNNAPCSLNAFCTYSFQVVITRSGFP